ncbi:PEGA domain-containing protein [Candidatus Wolfebacteria bacterium]|nr:PEGA domain-containing protein [Candidatus Wolfebacteria bacterium]
MSRLLRRLLFYCFSAGFIVTSIILILYTVGWSIDAKECFRVPFTCVIRKTGAIFIETSPRDVRFILDGAPHDDASGVIQSGTLIKNLRAGSHLLRIEKEGYRAWEKTLTVRANRVTEVLDTILIPEIIELSPTPFSALRGDAIEAVNPRNNMVIIKNEVSKTFYLYDRSAAGTALNLSLIARNLLGATIIRAAFHPFDNTRIIIETENELSLVNIGNRTVIRIAARPSAWDMDGGTINYIDTTPPATLWSFNLTTGTRTSRGRTPTSTTAITGIETADDIRVFKDSTGNLMTQHGDLPIMTDDGAKMPTISPDERKVAYLKDGKINIYFLREWIRGAEKKAGDRITIPSPGVIEDIAWHRDSAHLILIYKKDGALHGELADLDDREPRNRYDLARDGSSMRYHTDAGLLFIIRGGKLFFLPV